MELKVCVLLLFFVFCCSVGASSRRGNRRDTLNSLQGQIKTLEETQEEVRGDLVALQRGLKHLTDLVSHSLPENCYEAKVRGSRRRIVKVKPPTLPPRDVVCDQKREGGGWTVVLARYPTTNNLTARENFNKTWKEYREGFGDLHGEFWIGNDVLHALTGHAPHQLYIFLEDWNGNNGKGMWNHFKIGSEAESYRLSVQEYQHSSEIGNSFSHHHHQLFSTYDRDNDSDEHNNCSKKYSGGWWYFRCHMSHLTGVAVPPGEGGAHAITWRAFTHNLGLKRAYMFIRPLTPILDSCPK